MKKTTLITSLVLSTLLAGGTIGWMNINTDGIEQDVYNAYMLGAQAYSDLPTAMEVRQSVSKLKKEKEEQSEAGRGGLPDTGASGDDSTQMPTADANWLATCKNVFDTYIANDFDYSQSTPRGLVTIGTKYARSDCSTYVCECLSLYYGQKQSYRTSGTLVMHNGNYPCTTRLLENGTQEQAMALAQPGDIITWNGHTEIIVANKGTSYDRYSWGSKYTSYPGARKLPIIKNKVVVPVCLDRPNPK